MLTLQNVAPGFPDLRGLTITPLPVDHAPARFDLSVFLDEATASGRPAGLNGWVTVAADLFDRPAAERIGSALSRALTAVAADSSLRLRDLPVLTQAERDLAITGWNATARPVPAATLPGLFETQAAASPDAIALVFENRALSYRQLNANANQLARLLVRHGAGPESVVAVLLERSADLVTALLAVVKCGAAYLPVDPGYPAERIAAMLASARPACVLTSSTVKPLPAAAVPVISLDTAAAELSQLSAANLSAANLSAANLSAANLSAADLADADRTSPLQPAHPAYVIYTSGSTGQPKGVVITHAAIVNRLRWMQAEFGLHPEDRVLQKTPASFDVSVWEFFWPLLEGAQLVVAARADTRTRSTWPGCWRRRPSPPSTSSPRC